jgi:hypothetical protein
MGLADASLLKRPIPSYGPTNSLFLAHELLIRDVRVWLERCARRAGGEQGVVGWKDGNDAVFPLPGGTSSKGTGRVQPDAWFGYQVVGGATPRVLCGLVEADRGTERGQTRWREKVQSYAVLLAKENEQSLIAQTGYRNARVLIVTPDRQRTQALVGMLRTLLGELAGLGYAPGSIARLAQRFWLTEQACLAGDDMTSLVWQRPDQSGLLPLLPRQR